MMDLRFARLLDFRIRKARKRAFVVVLGADSAHPHEAGNVMAALRDFCCADKSCIGQSVEDTMRLSGRREVWLYIQDVMNFSDKQVRDFEEVHDEYFGGDDE